MRIAMALVLVTLSSACANDDSGANPYALKRDDDAVVDPGDVYRACAADSDCTLVGSTCNGCCAVAAISSELKDRFDVEREAACEDYQGGICDCNPPKLVARCVAKVCAEVAP